MILRSTGAVLDATANVSPTKFGLWPSPLRTDPPRFGRRSPLRIGFDEPTAVGACGEFWPKVRGNRPLPCRDTGRAIAVSPHQTLPILCTDQFFRWVSMGLICTEPFCLRMRRASISRFTGGGE